ncbi:MAG: hypothetical protein ACR2P3_03660 [Geminicoccaceae bacterium]
MIIVWRCSEESPNLAAFIERAAVPDDPDRSVEVNKAAIRAYPPKA